MDQQPDPRVPSRTDHHSSGSMDLTGVMPRRMQTLRNATQRQTPPHLPSTSISHSRPLPNVPSQIPINSQSYTLQNEQHRPLHTHNEQTVLFIRTTIKTVTFTIRTDICLRTTINNVLFTIRIFLSSTYNNFPTGPPVYHTSSTHHKTSIFSLPLLYRLLVIPSFQLYLLSKNHQLLLPLRISPFLQGGRTGVHGLKR